MIEHNCETRRNLEKLPYDTKVIIMAGGRGKRLEQITHGKIPKDFVEIDTVKHIRGVDNILAILRENKLTDITYSANYYLPQYEKDLSDKGIKFHYQNEGDGHGNDLLKIINEQGTNSQYLILPTDIYIHSGDLDRLLRNHKLGTVSWGINFQSYSVMNEYKNLLKRKNSTDLISKTHSQYYPIAQKDTNTELVYNTVTLILDPQIYLYAYKMFTRLTHTDINIDLYKDVGAILAEINRRNTERGKNSILNTVSFLYPVIDYGTVPRLAFLRHLLETEASSS